MEHHREQHVDDRRTAENERHDVEGKTAETKRVDDADCAKRAQPGANERDPGDGSTPFTDGGALDCDPSQTPVGP